MASEKLEAARATGSLAKVITVLREEARETTAKTGPPAREQVDVFEAAVRVSKELSGSRTQGADRRAVLRGVQAGTTITPEDTKAVTTKQTPRFAEMNDDQLQEINHNTLSSADLDGYIAELERRTPERPAPPEGDADLDDMDLGDNENGVQPGFEVLPWESFDPDFDPTTNGRQQ
jgi:hypothetical protein